MGAGALAVPALLGAGQEPARAAETGTRPDILSGDSYPIGFWWPPPPEETTTARYAQIADCGFTFVTGGNGVQDMPVNAAMLDAAAANDLPAIVVDNRISNIQTYPQDQWRSVIQAALHDYQPFPAFTGFNNRDEPNAALFGQIGQVNDILRDLDPSVLGYTNLFPTYANSAQLGTATYQDYLDRYVAEADPSFLSFDHYPLLGPSPAVRGDYFQNWVLVRNKALESGLPSWVFILACQHFGYRLPSEAEIRWQVNVSLAYGCKGIQYFLYWLPTGAGWYEGLVTPQGELTPLYFIAQRVNHEYLRPVGKQLLPLVSESVTHFGEAQPPVGVEVFTGDEWVSSASGDPVIISRFADDSAGDLPGDSRWLLVANRRFDAAAATTLTFREPVDGFEFDPSTEWYRPVRAGLPKVKKLDVRLAPGSARLYRVVRLPDD